MLLHSYNHNKRIKVCTCCKKLRTIIKLFSRFIDLAIDDRKPYLSIPDLIIRTKEGLLSTKLRDIDFHDSGELKEEVFQSKGGSLYLGSSASNLRLVFYEKGYEQNKKYGIELDENWNRHF